MFFNLLYFLIMFLKAFIYFIIFIFYYPYFLSSFFPTCQVRVVRFYVSLLRLLLLLRLLRCRAVQRPVSTCDRHVQCQPATAIIGAQCSLPDLDRDSRRPVFPAGPQPRLSALSVPCGPQPRLSVLSVPCRTSTARRYVKKNIRKNVSRYVRDVGTHVMLVFSCRASYVLCFYKVVVHGILLKQIWVALLRSFFRTKDVTSQHTCQWLLIMFLQRIRC